MLGACLSGQPSSGQVLNLGDPAPPVLGESAACRAQARMLRLEAEALRVQSLQGRAADKQSIMLGQARWREIAAILLERPDPMTECDEVLLGWRLVGQGKALDQDLASLANTDALTPATRDDSLWLLKRAAAMGLSPHFTPDSPLVATLELLCEALAPLDAPGGSTLPGAAELRARLESDADLQSAVGWLDRLCVAYERQSWLAPSGAATLDRLAALVDQVTMIDRAPWLSSQWGPVRSHLVQAALSEVLAARPIPSNGASYAVASIAGAVQRLVEHAQHPTRHRLRAVDYMAAVQSWTAAAAAPDSRAPWDRLYEALDSARLRRRAETDPTQRDLRLACKVLDDQSDQLERLMGEMIRRTSVDDKGSDPSWATLIGGHRANVGVRQLIVDLQASVEALATLDHRAGAQIWPRLSPLAQAVHDAGSREQLVALAGDVNEFAQQQPDFPEEAAWRAGEDWVVHIAGPHREAIVERLEALRRERAREIVEGAQPRSASDLAALRDLFRLAQLWRRLDAINNAGHSQKEAGGLGWPAHLPAERAAALRGDLLQAAALAVRGGVPFHRAVSGARRRAADAIILAHLASEIQPHESSGREPPGSVLEQTATHLLRRDAPDALQHRITQWRLLQFESAAGAAPTVSEYRDFLAQRIAETLWTSGR
jgi:hypothetical protein